jgi:aryl-alcohol dehydrogenase-like predicted oxidoreductase
MHEAVSCAIPGAKNPRQAADNAKAADLPEISPDVMGKIGEIYREKVRALVHHYW